MWFDWQSRHTLWALAARADRSLAGGCAVSLSALCIPLGWGCRESLPVPEAADNSLLFSGWYQLIDSVLRKWFFFFRLHSLSSCCWAFGLLSKTFKCIVAALNQLNGLQVPVCTIPMENYFFESIPWQQLQFCEFACRSKYRCLEDYHCLGLACLSGVLQGVLRLFQLRLVCLLADDVPTSFPQLPQRRIDNVDLQHTSLEIISASSVHFTKQAMQPDENPRHDLLGVSD